MTKFSLDSKLARDTIAVAALPLCEIRLMNDARFRWLILIPQRPDITELFQLNAGDRRELTEEIARVSRALANAVPCDKINVAALGNIVRQLHIHIVARHAGDAAWPGPVWGAGSPVPYGPDEAVDFARKLAAVIKASGRP